MRSWRTSASRPPDELLRAAEDVGKRLLEAYEKPPENKIEVLARYVRGDHSLDPLREFTEACRRREPPESSRRYEIATSMFSPLGSRLSQTGISPSDKGCTGQHPRNGQTR